MLGTTYKNAILAQDFLIKYNFADGDSLTNFNINNFHEIGMCDPFADDYKVLRGSINVEGNCLSKICAEKPEVLVYDAARLKPDDVPSCIYIPRKEIMLKLMRACV